MEKIFKDQTGNEMLLRARPERIISLVPSQTELLFDLGLGEKIVGITRFCHYPKNECLSKTKVGGTKNFDTDIIRKLQPDLIIGNKEENSREGIEELQHEFPVWMSDIFTLEDNEIMISEIGKMTGKEHEANILTENIRREFQKITQTKFRQRKYLYFIWQKPYMIAAQNTFINHLAELLNLQTIDAQRYPLLSEEEMQNFAPDIVLLSSEPFPFTEKHKKNFQKILPEAKIILVDGEMFSWYGSRIRFAPAYFLDLFHYEN
jgi:ABC-type Fe3+-hydroxamate transport system substrate-binding protein